MISIDTTCNREKTNFGICTSRLGHVFKWKIDEAQNETNIENCLSIHDIHQGTIIAAAKEHFIAVVKKN